MNEEERKLLKRKRNLIFSLMQDQFEENMYEEFMEREFESLDELDAFVEEWILAYDEELKLVDDYYNEKMYS